MEAAVKKVIKSAEVTMQNAILLQEQVHQLQSENGYRKRRKNRSKQFIQNGGTMTVAEGKEKVEEGRILQEPQPTRQRRPPTCSTCGISGHTRVKCSRK